MSDVRDVQSEIITDLERLLGPLATVMEGDVRVMFDSEDDDLPESFIVLQPGDTLEIPAPQNVRMENSVREQITVNIIPVTRINEYAPELRRLRLAIKQATAGQSAGLDVRGFQFVSFAPSTPVPPEPGRRWAFYPMPLQITYVQPLK